MELTEKTKSDTKVRTSITIDPTVLDGMRKAAESSGVSTSALIELACASLLQKMSEQVEQVSNV